MLGTARSYRARAERKETLLPISGISPDEFPEMGAHPGRHVRGVLRQLLPGGAVQSGSRRVQIGRRDAVLDDVPQCSACATKPLAQPAKVSVRLLLRRKTMFRRPS